MEPKALPKTLGLGDVFCIAVGAMISAGIFLLPAVRVFDRKDVK